MRQSTYIRLRVTTPVDESFTVVTLDQVGLIKHEAHHSTALNIISLPRIGDVGFRIGHMT